MKHGKRIIPIGDEEASEAKAKPAEDAGGPANSVRQGAESNPELGAAQAEVASLTDQIKRLAAEFDNYKKRVERDRKLSEQYAAAPALTKLLSVLDNLTRARQSAEKTHDVASYARGIEMTEQQFKKALEEAGVKEISTEGAFNPSLHEAIHAEPSDKPQNTIIEVIEKGYLLHDRVLRPARVKISGGIKENG
ncbi:Protein GrpE [uncultured archaeon]|nr:Protein GrpE [uncultured archaeon]